MLPARMIRLRGLAGLPSADEDLAAEVDEEPEDEEEEAEEGATWVTWRLELSDNT